MASLHGFISLSKFLHDQHLGLHPKHYAIVNAIAAKHNLVPRQGAPAAKGGAPRTWFRRADLEKLGDEILQACKAIAKNPKVVGVPHPYRRTPGALRTDGNGAVKHWPGKIELKAGKRRVHRKRIKGKPVRRNPLAQSPRRDSVLLSVPYGSNKTLLVTMEEGRQIHSHLDSVFTDE